MRGWCSTTCEGMLCIYKRVKASPNFAAEIATHMAARKPVVSMKEMMANLQAKAKANRQAKKGEAKVSPRPPQPSVVHSLRKTAYTLFLHPDQSTHPRIRPNHRTPNHRTRLLVSFLNSPTTNSGLVLRGGCARGR